MLNFIFDISIPREKMKNPTISVTISTETTDHKLSAQQMSRISLEGMRKVWQSENDEEKKLKFYYPESKDLTFYIQDLDDLKDILDTLQGYTYLRPKLINDSCVGAAGAICFKDINEVLDVASLKMEEAKSNFKDYGKPKNDNGLELVIKFNETTLLPSRVHLSYDLLPYTFTILSPEDNNEFYKRNNRIAAIDTNLQNSISNARLLIGIGVVRQKLDKGEEIHVITGRREGTRIDIATSSFEALENIFNWKTQEGKLVFRNVKIFYKDTLLETSLKNERLVLIGLDKIAYEKRAELIEKAEGAPTSKITDKGNTDNLENTKITRQPKAS